MDRLIDTILLNALPASGKSEVRRYLAQLDPESVRRDFHMGETVQLDDYPYVHMMRRISEELVQRGNPGVFFASGVEPFLEPLDWGTLIQLVNEDYRDLHERPAIAVDSAALWLFDRYDRCRERVGAAPALGQLPAELRAELAAALEDEARELLDEKLAGIPDSLEGRTIVIEFARGGADGSSMPLAAPFGYQYSYEQLSDEILERASILYIWVTPEESRRKNDERAKPGRDGDASILHHGVPIKVMMGDYGCDDIEYLLETSDRPDTVVVEANGKTHHLPLGRFDNRVDLHEFHPRGRRPVVQGGCEEDPHWTRQCVLPSGFRTAGLRGFYMTRALRLLSPLLLLALMLPAQAPAQDAEEPAQTSEPWTHQRDRWMLGISLGAGPGTLTNSLNGQTMEEWAGVVQLRGGGMISPKLLFHLELEAWLRNQTTGYDTSNKVDMFQYALALTWYPFDPASGSGGWWFRVGLGLANVRVEPDGDFAQESYSEGGWSMLAAAGYELRLTRTFAMGLGLSYDGLGVNGDVFSDSRFFAITADFNWYLQ